MLPGAYEIQTSSNMIQEFLGLNKSLRIADNQFSDMKNLTSDFYPVMSPRQPRGLVKTLTTPKGFNATDKLCWVENGKFYYDGNEVKTLTGDEERTIVKMGAYLCVFPDKFTYNTSNNDLKEMENTVTTTGTVTYSLAKQDGTAYDTTKISVGTTEPTNKTTFPYWLDTSVTPNVLKMWASTYSMWQPVTSTFIKIDCTDIGNGFDEYDAVTISGSTIADLNTSTIIYSKADDYIVVAGLLNSSTTQTDSLTIERKVPDMDFVCESGNRLWGCSSENHEIYASKLGNPWNFNVFMGLSTDSYTATIGSSGDFTGCIAHLGYVLFFKEDTIHKVYGSVPSNFQISDVHCRGVQKGSEKSLTLVSETLFYKSRDGVCMFDGSMPANISSVLGTTLYYDAVGGRLNDKYYISMRDSQDTWYLYVYDASRGMWHLEDNTQVQWFAYCYGALYYIDSNSKMYIVNNDYEDNAIYPGMQDSEFGYPDQFYPGSAYAYTIDNDVEWMAESGDIGLETIENKYIKKINVRLFLNSGSNARLYVQYDSSGEWEMVTTITNTDKRTYIIPILPKRCDHMRIKINGTGDAKLYSIQKVTEKGSEINVTT